MIAKLPTWIWFGGWVLALIAGTVNAVGFLGISHQAITHLTGTATLSTIAVAHGDFVSFGYLAALLLSFMGGAILSGYLIQHSTLQLGRPYGMVLALESILLLAAIGCLTRGWVVGDYLAAAACGLQNAMATSYSGAVIRTTHISGMVTDIGIIVGHLLRGIDYDARRLRLYILLLSGFLAGGLLGSVLFLFVSYWALLFPAVLTGVAAMAYSTYATRKEK